MFTLVIDPSAHPRVFAADGITEEPVARTRCRRLARSLCPHGPLSRGGPGHRVLWSLSLFDCRHVKAVIKFLSGEHRKRAPLEPYCGGVGGAASGLRYGEQRADPHELVSSSSSLSARAAMVVLVADVVLIEVVVVVNSTKSDCS